MGKSILSNSTSSSTPYAAWTNGYNDTPFNRWKTLFQIAISRHIPSRRHSNSSIIYLSSTTLVKYGCTVHLSEASALLFLASFAPNIPIPKLHCAFRDDKNGKTYIVMKRIDGQSLSDTWSDRSRKEKDRLLAQVKSIFGELRALKKPPGKGITDEAVCAADGGKLHDHRIWNAAGEKGLGPFSNDAEFNLFLRNGVSNTDSIIDPEKKAEIQKLIEMHRESEEGKMKTVFTHGDVSLSNILVKEGKVVGIVDWEMAGWYPWYWEYTTAINTHYIKGWREEIGKFLDEWPQEKEMDDLWRKLYCDGP
ncbi:kinase-like domain-containing protein [Tricladium varicosporioides]|nr:kinase-like domain-containing protein [Hymenoscyphus varicosporioides]